jgi:galactoside O-acetyltransferase
MSNPTVPLEYRKVRSGDVVLKKHALVGSGSVIMPSVTLGIGASVGALSFVNRDVPEFAIVAGTPARIIGQRNRRILDLERKFLADKSAALFESV